jgi:hypothetical protein
VKVCVRVCGCVPRVRVRCVCRLGMLPFATQGLAQIVRRGLPLRVLLHRIPHPRPPCLRQPRPHRPRELLLARMASPPCDVPSVSRLRDRHLHHAADVHQARLAAARAARLDRRRLRPVADVAGSVRGHIPISRCLAAMPLRGTGEAAFLPLWSFKRTEFARRQVGDRGVSPRKRKPGRSQLPFPMGVAPDTTRLLPRAVSRKDLLSYSC